MRRTVTLPRAIRLAALLLLASLPACYEEPEHVHQGYIPPPPPAIGQSAPVTSPLPRAHVVQPGDTMQGIAQQYGVAVEELAARNGVAPTIALRTGARVVLPPEVDEDASSDGAPPERTTLPSRLVARSDLEAPFGLTSAAMLQGVVAALVMPLVTVLGFGALRTLHLGAVGVHRLRGGPGALAHAGTAASGGATAPAPVPIETARAATAQTWTVAAAPPVVTPLPPSAPGAAPAPLEPTGREGESFAAEAAEFAPPSPLARYASIALDAFDRGLGVASTAARRIPGLAFTEVQRRRGPFRDGGDFWLRGSELLRVHFNDEAERHYWDGYYHCHDRGWNVEAGQCLERIAHIAELRGDLEGAARYLQNAADVFEGHDAPAQLADAQRRIRDIRSTLATEGTAAYASAGARRE